MGVCGETVFICLLFEKSFLSTNHIKKSLLFDKAREVFAFLAMTKNRKNAAGGLKDASLYFFGFSKKYDPLKVSKAFEGTYQNHRLFCSKLSSVKTKMSSTWQ